MTSNNHNCEICNEFHTDDNPRFILENAGGAAFVYWDQSYSGRTIVALKVHAENILELDPIAAQDLYREMLSVAKAVSRSFNPSLMNFAMLGNRTKHIHWHIIPRYQGDFCWGEAPWPHPRIPKPPEEYRKIAARIREAYFDSVGQPTRTG